MTDHTLDAAGAHRTHRSQSRSLPDGRRSRFHRTQDDRDLSELMTAWAKRAFPHDMVTPDYIRDEFASRLRSYRKSARAWRGAQVSIWALIAILGLLTTVFAGFSVGHGFTIVGGALIATLTTFSNAARPAQKADGYSTARSGLRDEGWAMMTGTDAYGNIPDPAARFAHFVNAVHGIVETKRQNTNLDGLAQGNPPQAQTPQGDPARAQAQAPQGDPPQAQAPQGDPARAQAQTP